MNEVLKELNVLYVDDDKNACESLRQILNYYFKEVFLAFNGKEALKIVKSQTCHLLIVDYEMPVMDGHEFLSTLRESGNETPAFILSSYDDKEKLKNAIKLNLLDYLVKPYELSELKHILKVFAQHISQKGLVKYQLSKECFYEPRQKTIQHKEKKYSLTAFEVKIFELLLKQRNKVVHYDELLNLLNSTSHKSLLTLIYKLKKKLPDNCILNIKDVGYKLN